MTKISRLIVWTPRLLGVLLALFVAMFALDVFGEFSGFWATAVALAIHLVPSAIVLAVLAIAWRWRIAGGVIFILAGVAYALSVPSHPSWIAVIAGPLWLVGALFVISARWREPTARA